MGQQAEDLPSVYDVWNFEYLQYVSDAVYMT